jgi:hypothetical protein
MIYIYIMYIYIYITILQYIHDITVTLPTSHGLHLQAPAKRKLRERRMPFDPKAEPGAMEPLGYFDPLGLCPPGGQLGMGYESGISYMKS